MTAVRLTSRQWKVSAIAAVIALGVLLIVAFSGRQEAVEVWTAPAVYSDLSQEVTTNGTVIPTSEFQARAIWPGIIEKVNVELGDRVRPGQLLVSMKDPFAISRLTAADAALEAARVGQENLRKGGTQEERITLAGDLQHAAENQAKAAKALAALQQLHAQGAASGAEIAAAEQRLDSESTTLQTLRNKSERRFTSGDLRSSAAHVADAQANVDAAKIQFNNANMSSPIAGTVYSIKVVPYDWVPVGADLIRVADLNSVEVRAYFDEPEIGELHSGQEVRITWDGKPGRTWHGHIKQAPIAATTLGPRSVGECLIAVDDSREDLLPNTNVMVTVTIEQRHHVVSVPHTALRMDGSHSYVFCLVDGIARKTPVETGIVTLDRAEITRGLAVNDLVVLNAADNREVRDGFPVRAAGAPPARSGNSDLLLKRMLTFRSN